MRSYSRRTLDVRYGVISIISVSSILAIVVVASALVSVPFASRADAVTPPDSCFATTGTITRTITNYYDFEGNNPANPACPRNVDIPSTIGGGTVTAVSSYGMASKGLTALTLPGTLTDYAGYSFAYNQITQLVVPEGVTSIGTGVFRQNALTSVTLPSTLTSIGDRAFVDNDLLSVDIPDGVTYIGPRAFWGNALTTVTIPSSVQTIASESFLYNYGLSEIIFEGTVTTFGTSMFTTSPIQTVEYNGTTYTLNDIGPTSEYCFAATGGTITSYTEFNFSVLRDHGDPCMRRALVIPNTVSGVPITAIGDNAVNYNNLVSVVIPSTVTSIGSSAFSGNFFTSLTLPAGLTTIGSNAFYNNDIVSLVIPDAVTSIGASAFAYNALTAIDIPDNVVTLSDRVFENNAITSAVIGESVTTIGLRTFYNNQITQITIPASVTAIGASAFSYSDLTSLVFEGNTAITFGTYAFSGNKLETVSLPDGTPTVPTGLFYGNYLTSVSIPDSVTSIGHIAFAFNALSEVRLGPNVTSVDRESFIVQSQYGRDLDGYASGEVISIWDSDPASVQEAYDSIWYARLYTDDPSNPHGLSDAVHFESEWAGYDSNENGNMDDILGGHLINPGSVTLNYRSETNAELQQSVTYTGKIGATQLSDYLVSSGPSMTAPATDFSPTFEEQEVYEAALLAYYRIGQSVTYTASYIEGYITPDPATRTFVLGAATNNFSYIYTQPGSGGTLADTGMNVSPILKLGIASIVLATGLLLARAKVRTSYR